VDVDGRPGPARELGQTADVIRMAVRHQDVANLTDRGSQRGDRRDDLVAGARLAAVDEHQTVVALEQVGADESEPDAIEPIDDAVRDARGVTPCARCHHACPPI
jgi:hypothetical protein